LLAPCALLGAATLSGCGPDAPNDATTTNEASSSGTTGDDPSAVPRRFFGKFHRDEYKAGDVFTDDPDDLYDPSYVISHIEILADGRFRYSRQNCVVEPTTYEYPWSWDPQTQTLSLSAEGTPSEPHIDLFFDTVDQVTISAGDGCDDLIMTILDNDEPKMRVFRYLPGELCLTGKSCNFTLDWCDGPPPVCTP
jgi:hypothetical protein